MRLRLLSAGVAACGLLLAVPVSAQGVKIGILNDQSGVYADYGGKWSFEAAKMAVEDFGGSVLGHRIEIVSADHQNKPDLGVSIARRWHEVENVDMITELTTLVGRPRGARFVQADEEDRHRGRRCDLAPEAMPASLTAFTGPTTPTRWPTAPAASWWMQAATPGSS